MINNKVEVNVAKKRRKRRKFNSFKVLNDKVSIMFDEDGNSTLIDTEDIKRLSIYYWKKRNTGYWTTYDNICLHRFVMECPYNKIVDHIHHDKNDHRKSELRICSVLENNRNRSKEHCKNKTGFMGVTKKRNKYSAQICVNYEVIYLGLYSTPEEAYEARLKAEKVYYKGGTDNDK